MFSDKDREQLTRQGITNDKINWQLKVFRKGVSYIDLHRPATIGDGILQINDEEQKRLVEQYALADCTGKMKFVPASGAASRMFKSLFEYIGEYKTEDVPSDTMVEQFFNSLSSFAFYSDLDITAVKKGLPVDKLLAAKKYVEILKLVLYEEGLNYGFLPKGLLKFHTYGTSSRTPFEEHLVEAALYGSSEGKPVKLHFTVSPEHKHSFTELLEKVGKNYEKRFGVEYQVGFSVQKPSTDTLAVDLNNEPFRNPDGSLLFRPGGHGALIDNLNELDTDIIFIKNIDNVVPEKYVDVTVTYKKILAAKLLEIQNRVFLFLRELDSDPPEPMRLKEIFNFIGSELNYRFVQSPDLNNINEAIPVIRRVLNRPVRVCGVVKNLGEPGGGPFWAPNSMGDSTLQIIESSQVNKEDKEQATLFSQATHFNPVDLVCGVRNYKGEKFHLPDFIDPNTYFISQKSKDGKELKALELPGLWNGSMSDWTTLFVEVPVETFNPVKTVNDLLRQEHQ